LTCCVGHLKLIQEKSLYSQESYVKRGGRAKEIADSRSEMVHSGSSSRSRINHSCKMYIYASK